MTYAETYGQPQANGHRRVHVRCGDCGQRVVEANDGDIRCPDAPVGLGPCGRDPLTRERAFGPRYAEAIRGARLMRKRAFHELNIAQNLVELLGPGIVFGGGAKRPGEREHGSPVGWWLR